MCFVVYFGVCVCVNLGAVDMCCFDKTGTLTSDAFQVVGVTKLQLGSIDFKKLHESSIHKHGENPNDSQNAIPLHELLVTNAKNFTHESAIVIGGCHSLVYLEGKILGDPLEKSALTVLCFLLCLLFSWNKETV